MGYYNIEMIFYLEGKIELKRDDFLVLDVNNVGYKVFCVSLSLSKLPREGEKVKLFTYYYNTRENIPKLYGFLDLKELEFFELLISVSGIGPKGAMEILAGRSIEEIKSAINSGDKKILSQVAGVGEKKAQKIILELESKIKTKEKTKIKDSLEKNLAVEEALIKLGYSRQKIRKTLKELPLDIKEEEAKIKEVLKQLGK